MRGLLFLLAVAASAAAQSPMRSTVTLGGGWAQNVGRTCCGDTAPNLAVSYAYRLFPFLAVEAGVDASLSLGTEIRGAHYDIHADDRFFWVPFGLRGVLPLRDGRVELSLSAGGLYERYHVGNPADFAGLVSRDGWGGYAGGCVALATDRDRHFWIGAAPRFFFANTNRGYTHDRWFVLNGEVSVRF